MFRSIKSVLFSLLFVFALASCEKETSLELGNQDTGGFESGTAEYTLLGEPLPCTTPLISGDYVVGTALDISNTILLNVDVTTVGDYSIGTGTINGIRFVGAGTFATTGPQTITLFGDGTPVSATTWTYVPGRNGCSFTITPTTSVIVPTGPLFYEATIDGSHYREDVDGTIFENGFAVNGTTDDVYLSSSIQPIVPGQAGTSKLTITKGILHSYTSVTNLTFKSFFPLTSIPYGSNPSDGVEITWLDEAGNLWSTSKAPGTQTGSNFIITAVSDEPGLPHYSVRVSASYTCTLYDDAGNSVALTSGSFVGIFSKL